MKIVSLKKLVEENDIKEIVVAMGEGVKPVTFKTDSPDYREQKAWFVKGDYRFGLNPSNEPCLFVERLEKDIEISINKPTVNGEQLEQTEEEKQLEAHLNTPITAFVFHRTSLVSAGKEMKRMHVTPFAEAVLKKYQEDKGEATLADFAVVEIDWNNRHIVLKSISEPVKEGEK